nr:unnamed protein product [Callosobruchus chinensis]
MCFSEPDRGQCDGNFHKFYYDRRDGVCKVFAYGGCGGNRNNFDTMEECLTTCGASQGKVVKAIKGIKKGPPAFFHLYKSFVSICPSSLYLLIR